MLTEGKVKWAKAAPAGEAAAEPAKEQAPATELYKGAKHLQHSMYRKKR